MRERAFSGNRIWEDAVSRWLDDHDTDKDRMILQWLASHLNGKPLHEIDQDIISELRALKAGETSKATANRYMALLRAVLNACRDEWGWLVRSPKVPMYTLPPTDYEWLTQEEFEALLPHLPAHTQQLARFAVATGLRRTNITHLRWKQVDMKRRHAHIQSTEAKAKKAISVPLNRDAMAVLREQRGQHRVWVFTYQGEPVYQVATKAWRKAVDKIGRPGFRFHDLRHTWASWHVQAGTPLHILQRLGGWSSYEMVLRYAHLDHHTLAEYSENAVTLSPHGQENGGSEAA